MIKKEKHSSRKIHRGIAVGARGTMFVWLFSLLVGCAIPSASTPATSRAQEFVAQPFPSHRVKSDSPTAPWFKRIFATRHQQGQARSTKQQPVPVSSSELQPTIQLASYQQDANTRVYSTPTPATAPANETFYPGQEYWGYQNESMPPRREVYPPPSGRMAPGHYRNQSNHGQQPVRRSIEHGGAVQRSHPSQEVSPDIRPGYRYRESASQSFNPRNEHYEYDKEYLRQLDAEYESSLSSSAVDGRARGHFSQGPALQGSSLNPAIRTATEIAMDLKIRNSKLSDAFSRTQQELNKKMQELAEARAEAEEKDQQLAKASLLEERLRATIGQLTAKLQLAEHQKSELRRQSDETLKEIETTLDEALIHNFSKKRDD